MAEIALCTSLDAAHRRLERALDAADRPAGSARLLAVSKTKPAAMLREAWQHGQRAFGENYLQEALDKQRELADLDDIEWHFIGPLQSNKTRAVAEHFDWMHTVEREKIARRLDEQRPAHLPPLNVCLQVNISGEASKAGVAPEDALALAREIATLERLSLRGLMAIPAPCDDPKRQREPFAALKALLGELQTALPDAALDTLSMGMSDDLEAAVFEGATLVRLGSAIFGARVQA
ncbi:YggS family pyridoxal phosphate-dependent enzyme [Halomonas sp. PAMB 3264]|uniref:YggS family pyridoxal phosphate-dependent enzyme n=1 Tax=Halomonas sp. PAMB 3264 TaxID=3075222 RepID=UPI00289A6934|nr:YggS family pyridoxal phosphate-dependent enzyme [Halomonas sp. PAMB 3264]WNL42703.1 YggS family pyridoxal phosphate-dependent enzyme [Halomonas sp. PAMB 3264]